MSAAFELTIVKAAAFLGVSVGTLRRWSDDGSVPSVRTPAGQRRFSQSDLDAFVESRRQK